MGKIRAGESLPKVFRIPDAASEGRAVPDAILQQSEDCPVLKKVYSD
jgi:hypothetical protein